MAYKTHNLMDPIQEVFPRTTEEVVDLVRQARKSSVALVPSGGRTGLSGGADTSGNEIRVSLSKMNRVLELNSVDRTLECEAGVITQAAQEFARDHGFFFPVDFASRGSSQLGGNVATNAGGIRVVRYGSFREWVAGLEFVTGTGEVIRANRGLVKNATGYDFRHLMIGSEGTLGIVTRVLLKLTNPPHKSQVYLFSLANYEAIMPLYLELRDHLPLLAFEVFTESALQYVLVRRREAGRVAQHPFAKPSRLYVLAEVETQEIGVVETALERGWIADGVSSQNDRQSRDLWAYREEISEALAVHKPFKGDVSVRVSQVGAFVSELEEEVPKRFPSLEVIWFGHLGDGNLHINVLNAGAAIPALSEWLFKLIQKHDGSISAEHGIGLLKRDALLYTRTEAEVNLMRGIKKVFDPDGILNPGKIFRV